MAISREEILEYVAEAAAKVAEKAGAAKEPIALETEIYEIPGVDDSLDLIDFMMHVEESFKEKGHSVELDENDPRLKYSQHPTVLVLVEVIEEKLSA